MWLLCHGAVLEGNGCAKSTRFHMHTVEFIEFDSSLLPILNMPELAKMFRQDIK